MVIARVEDSGINTRSSSLLVASRARTTVFELRGWDGAGRSIAVILTIVHAPCNFIFIEECCLLDGLSCG